MDSFMLGIGAPVCHASATRSTEVKSTPRLDHRGAIEDNCEQITLFPALTASRLPFSSLSVSFFLCTLGDDDRPLALPRYIPLIPIYFAVIFLTIFLYIRHNDDTYTHSSPTPLLLTTQGTQMYSSSLLVDDGINTTTSCQSISVFSLSSCVRSHRLVILAFVLVDPLSAKRASSDVSSDDRNR
jgi:hypothetical protein